MASKPTTNQERQLRIALVWNGTIVEEHQLERPVRVGFGRGELFALPDTVSQEKKARVRVLEPSKAGGYRLLIGQEISGSVWLGGRRTEIAELGAQGHSDVDLGPEDYGVITLGPVALFFQPIRPARPLPRQGFDFDPALVASFGLACFLMASFFVLIALWGWERRGLGDDLELDSSLVSQFLVYPPPPPPEVQARESGTNQEDPGLRQSDEMGGRAEEREEGRVGHQDAQQEDTHIEGEVREEISARVRGMGLLGALSGGGNDNAIAQALDVPTVSQILGGMGPGATVIGRGTGGAGLRGVGNGGGGTGPGVLFGAGRVGTGSGAGNGSGHGSGSGGPGAPGRPREEVQIHVATGHPAGSGGLSMEQVARVVRQNASAIRYCYEAQVQQRPNLRGTINIGFAIDPGGGVSTARVASSSMGDAGVEGCVIRVFRRMRFPSSEAPTRVTFPLNFGSAR